MSLSSRLGPILAAEGLETDTRDKQALEALNTVAKKVGLPVKFTAKALERGFETPVKVPKGFESLFKQIVIAVEWDRGLGFARIKWSYSHPAGGSNGLSVGSVSFDVSTGGWGWRTEEGDWGLVGE